MLMTTDPGDLVLDPTCGSGTTAYVAEQWGRRWITIDTSRVPLALARQRLLTATFPYYELKDDARGPAGGFVYKRKQNSKGEEVGGIVPHVTLKSIANNEPPDEEVLVDRPEVTDRSRASPGHSASRRRSRRRSIAKATTASRGSGGADATAPSSTGCWRCCARTPVLKLGGNRKVTLKNVRPPAKTLALSAEAMVAERRRHRRVASSSAPRTARSARGWSTRRPARRTRKGYAHLYVIGFAIEPNARELIEKCEAVIGIPATYVQATPDLVMGDLLKTMRSSQIFSVCGLPEVELRKVKPEGEGRQRNTRSNCAGLDVFDPTTMEDAPRHGDDVPAWFLDTDYNGLCFHVSQAFFPRTSAWDNLKKALHGDYDEAVWDHLAGHHQRAVRGRASTARSRSR